MNTDFFLEEYRFLDVPGNRHGRFGPDVDGDGFVRGSSLQRSGHFPGRSGSQDAAPERVQVCSGRPELLFVRAERDQATHEEGSRRLDAGDLRRPELQSGGLQPGHELPRPIPERLPHRTIPAPAPRRRLPHGRLQSSGTRVDALRQADRVLGLHPQSDGHHGEFEAHSFLFQ